MGCACKTFGQHCGDKRTLEEINAECRAKRDARSVAESVCHGFGPVYNEDSELLILGSFPSIKSREEEFYYANPQNRFWKVLATLFGAECPDGISEKRSFLEENKVALYDVVESCDITGSQDSSISNVTPADISQIVENSKVGDRIYTNGAKAHELYMQHIYPMNGIEATKLPSTSSANAACSLRKLIKTWRKEIFA